MRSSWLLFTISRRKLWVCLFIEVVVVFLIAINDVQAHQPHSVRDVMGVSLILATLLGLWAYSPTRFNSLPFPVSVRQRAWLPLLGVAVVWAGGGVAILVALLSLGVSPFRLTDFFLSALPLLPLYILGFLIVFRFLRMKPHLFGFACMAVMIPQSTDSSWFKAYAGTYPLWWPVALVAIAFYLYEAPILLARRDRLLVGQANAFRFRFPDLMIAGRRHGAIWVADTVEAAILLSVILIFLFSFLPTHLIIPFFSLEFGLVPVLIGLLFIAWLFVSGFKALYQISAASGFSPASAVGMTLMQMTIVLIPLAQALGVKKGVMARCDQCRMAKFLWSPHCPNCGNPGPGTIANKRLARVAQGKPIASIWRIKFMGRAFIPLQLFVMFGLFGTFGNRPFVTHSAILRFRGDLNPQTRESAHSRIKEMVADHPDPAAWIASANIPDGSALGAPKKFRLEVQVLDGGNVWISGHGLRWEPAQALPEAVARRLAGEVEVFRQVDSSELRESSSRAPIFQARGYLDNQLHWVQPRK